MNLEPVNAYNLCNELTELYNKLARFFYRWAYRAVKLRFYFTRPTISGVYVAVWHEGRLLVIRNSYKASYTIPCGRIKRGENTAHAAVRELNEEVGIQLDPEQLSFVGTYTGQFRYASDIGSFFEVVMSRMPPVTPDNREVIWAQFMTLDQIRKLPLNPTVKAWLRDKQHQASQNQNRDIDGR